jgi:CRP-like cAMP-binding protein
MTLGIARTGSPYHGSQEDPARIRATIARAPLFAQLSIAAIEDLTQRVSVKRVAAHTTIVSQDEPGDSMFLIMSGRVKVVIFGENGREVTLSILRPGDGFGEMSLFDGESRSANCIANEPTTLLALTREDLLRHLTGHPQTALNLLGEMARRLRRADETIAQLALCDVNERLIHRLVMLAKDPGRADHPARPRAGGHPPADRADRQAPRCLIRARPRRASRPARSRAPDSTRGPAAPGRY